MSFILLFVIYSLQDINTKPTNSSSPSSSPLCLTCEQLVNSFTNIYRSMAKREGLVVSDSDVSIGINQIRAFLDEFSKMKYAICALTNIAFMTTSSSLDLTNPSNNSSRHALVHYRTVVASFGCYGERHDERKSLTQEYTKVTILCYSSLMWRWSVTTVTKWLVYWRKERCVEVRHSLLLPVCQLFTLIVCSDCNHTAHDSCVKKVTQHCEGKVSDREGDKEVHIAWSVRVQELYLMVFCSFQSAPKSQFGVPLSKLVPAGSVMVPTVLEKCFVCLEEHGKNPSSLVISSLFSLLTGLYTAGIYRRSAGPSSKRAVREAVDTGMHLFSFFQSSSLFFNRSWWSRPGAVQFACCCCHSWCILSRATRASAYTEPLQRLYQNHR